jgi:hypothetical protein
MRRAVRWEAGGLLWCCVLLMLGGSLLRAAPANLAVGRTVQASSSGYGSVPDDAVDGNRDGQFFTGGSVWHTLIPDVAPWIEVDLGADFHLDRIMLWPRTDQAQATVRNLRIRVTDEAGAVVHDEVVLANQVAGNVWGTVSVRGVRGRMVRLERTDVPANPDFLTFAELEIHGQRAPVPANLALRKPWTASNPGGYGTPPDAGNDGIIDGDYNHTGRPVYHSRATGTVQHYEIDLSGGEAVDQAVDFVRIYNRTDFTVNRELRLSLRAADGREVWQQVVNVSREVTVRSGRQYDVTVEVPGVVDARWARVDTVGVEALSFAELEVFGPEQDRTPPAVDAVDPAAGSRVAELAAVTVTFSEPITGIEAADLLVNGEPCAAVAAQSPLVWWFRLASPAAAGLAKFSWREGHGIADAEGNALDARGWEVTVDPTAPVARPYVSEILCDNRGGLKDEDGDSPDWIEVTNGGPVSMNLGGWHLSDDLGVPAKWRIPSPLRLEPGASVVVFASGKNRAVPGAPLHTGFRLSASGGSVLLSKPDGVTVVSVIRNYPRQLVNVSYGIGLVGEAAALLVSGADGHALVPGGPVPGWEESGFAEAGWRAVRTGVGFDATSGMNGEGPMVLWRFNDAAQPSVAADATGQGRTGSVSRAVYTADGGGVTGKAGDRALSFGGTGVMTVASAAAGAFDAVVASNEVAVSAWTYGSPAQPSAGYLFYAGGAADGSGTRVLGAHLPWSDSVIYWDTGGCCDSGQHRIAVGEPNAMMWRGRWNHYVFQKKGNWKEIWQNGQLLTSGENVAPMLAFRSFLLGAGSVAGTNPYDGLVDDVAMWSRALTASQIGALAVGVSPLEILRLSPWIRTHVGSSLQNVSSSLLLRMPFDVADPASLDLLTLRMRYDDGFVAYLNGREVARRNAPDGTVPWDGRAVEARPAGSGAAAEEISLVSALPWLVAGRNVLAVHGLNASADDGDFLIEPELTAGRLAGARFFRLPTPGKPNGEGVSGFTADTKFSPDRGFYGGPLDVTVSCATPGAVVVTTTDGSVPTLSNGVKSASPAVVRVTATTTLRAAAYVPGTDLGPPDIDTHSYVLVDTVAAQRRPAAAPVTWPGGHPADFLMDARIVNGALPGYGVRESLLALPTLSVSMDPVALWGTGGIYANSGSRGDAWEKAASVEWLDPAGGPGFRVGCGVAVHGNISRDKSFTPKHSFKLRFRSEYGDTKLRFPLFPGSAVEEFDGLVLRGGSTDTFPCGEWGGVPIGPNGASVQRWARKWASYVRDQWVRDTQLVMGHESARGRYCHLYLNGIYWGLYNVCERPDGDFMESHFGGKAEDYDVLADFAEVKSGNASTWNQMMSLAGASANDAVYWRLAGRNPDGSRNPAFPVLLDVENLIDYMILHIFHGADDWPNHNWWAANGTRRGAETAGFRWFSWDQEISNVSVLYERSSWQNPPAKYADVNATGSPAYPYYALRVGSPVFRMHFADRVHRHLFHGGALSTGPATVRWQSLVAGIDRAIVAESARWGDYQPNLVRPGQPYRREVEWLGNLGSMAVDFWPKINAAALRRYRDAGLYPALDAPVPSQAGGWYRPGFRLALANPNAGGTIRFTLDGSDPRRPDGTVAAAAQTYAEPLLLSGRRTVRARVLSGSVWSALLDLDFVPHPDEDDDGMEDAWERLWGLDPANPADASWDSDGDGRTNHSEYAAGTSPQDAADVLRAVIARDGGEVEIRFTARGGRWYGLQVSDGSDGWRTVAERAASQGEAAHVWRVPLAGTRRFYRVVGAVP